MTAAQEAHTALIDHLGAPYGLRANDAYILCSVVADLRIGEVVNRPNWIVTAEVPLGIFD
jgi:acetamidase/formamidase